MLDCRTRRPVSAKSIAWCSKAWGGGWAEKVRWSPARKMMCRLLARMTSQRRSVPCAELAAVRAGSARCDGGPSATRPEALQVVDAGAARMFSSPKHTPLRVRVRPGGACEAHGTASRCSRRAWRHAPGTRAVSRLKREAGCASRLSAREAILGSYQLCCQPLGCLRSAGERTTARFSDGGRPCCVKRRVRLFSSFQTLNTYLRCP